MILETNGHIIFKTLIDFFFQFLISNYNLYFFEVIVSTQN